MAECPPAVFRDHDLPMATRLVLVALWSYAGRGRRFVWPSRERLAADLGINERTLRRHLALLREREWITEAEGAETRGNPGWFLCDPPGTPQILGVEAPVGVTNPPDKTGRSPDKTGRDDRTKLAERTEMTGPTGQSRPPLPYRNLKYEPSSYDGGSTVQGAEASSAVSRSGGAGGGFSTSGWMSDFDMLWRGQDFGGVIVSNPTIGARRAHGLSEALYEHGGTVVADVLLHAAHEAARHLRGGGSGGLDPRILAVAFRAEKPSFGALLDRWQRDTRRKRTSGKVSNPPGELKGIPLTDEEQRLWMVTGGDADAIVALRRKREAERSFTEGLLDGVVP